MLKHRVIPCLLLKNGGLVKTVKFSDPKYVGDPVNAIRIFNEKEVDELMVLDIVASKERKEPDFAMIEQFAGECFMPLCYGGGVNSVEHARQLFSLGVEKICLQTAALENPFLITKIAKQFGSQSVLVSIDIKRNWRGKALLFSSVSGRTLDTDWQKHLKDAVIRGAGEVVINSVNNDGVMKGLDLDLIREASSAISIPLVAVGGVGSLKDIKSAVDAGASAVGVGSFFVFHGPHRAVLISYPVYGELEELLKVRK